ncbi:MAG: class I SAM-dependent methyltransferase [Candidatus Hermodarchaeota archaeon]
MRKLDYIFVKPIIFYLSRLSVNIRLQFISRLISGVVSREKDPKKSLKFLLNLDQEIYSLTGIESIRYEGGLHTKHRHTKYHDFFIKNINDGDHVLDIGCGNGLLSYDIIQNVNNVKLIGIDISKEKIETAKEKYIHPNLKFINGNALKDLPNKKFDVVILSNVLEHFENRVEFLKQVKRRTKSSTYLVRVPLFERDWRVPLKKELGLDYRLDPTHYIEYTQEKFFEELEKVSLKVENLEIRWSEIWAVVKNHVQVQ